MLKLNYWKEEKFSRLCLDILHGLGLKKAKKFNVKGVKQAYRISLVRESSDGMFRSDDIQLCVFVRALKPLQASRLQLVVQAALAAEATQVLLVVFGEVDNEAAQDLHDTLQREQITLSLLTRILAETLALDFTSDTALQKESKPLDISFKHLRAVARQYVEEALWRQRFQTIPLQPARVLPLHAEEDDAIAEADLFRALRGGSFLLLGEPGAGKTTALLALAAELAQSGTQIPLFVPLGRYQGDFSALLGELLAVGEHPLSASITEALLHTGLLTILLDGINEVQDADLQARLVTDINRYTAAGHAGAHSRWVVTGRVHDYEQSRNRLNHLEQRRWEMQSLTPDLVYRYLANALGEAPAKALYDDLGQAVREICANPLLLSMVLDVYQQTGAVPTGRSALYREFIRLLLSWGDERDLNLARRQELAALLPAMKQPTAYVQQAELALTALAAVMPATFIGWEQARQQLITHLPDCTNPSKAAALLLEDLIQHGLLRRRGYNSLSFYHHTFQEYFRARTLVNLPLEQLVPDIGVPADRRESVVFLAGFMDDPKPLLERAMRLDLRLAYELLRSVPQSKIVIPAKALAQNLWNTVIAGGGIAGKRRTYAVLFQQIAAALNQGVESLAAELDDNLEQEQHVKNLMIFYSELGDTQAQQRILGKINAQQQPPQALLVQVAQAAFRNEDYERSVDLYSQVLQQNPNSAVTFNNRGLAYRQLGKTQQARADYERAVELEDKPVHRLNLAILLHEQGEKDQAIVQARSALQQDPTYANAHHWLADWLEKQDPIAALKHRKQAVQYAPHEDDLRWYCQKLARLQETQDQPAAAIRTLRRLIELDPTSNQVKDWKQRIARLRQVQDQQERELSDRRRLQESGELPLPKLVAAWLQAAGLTITAATGTDLLAAGGRDLPDPLPVLLLPESEITPATLREAIKSMPRTARKAKQAVLVSAADTLSLEARQQLAALQDERDTALITALEVRDALLQSDVECRLLLDSALRQVSETDPFAYKKVVKESTEFFGRVNELQQLTQNLSKGQSIGVYGIHKIGKSSLLEQLRRKLHVSHPNITIVQLELDRTLEHAGQLYRRILERLPSDLDLPADSSVSADYFRRTLSHFHAQQEQKHVGHRLLLVLDEYAYLLPTQQGSNDFLSALSLFKTLVQEGWLLFLPCGRTAALNRQGSWHGEENPFVGILHPLFLAPLPRDEHDGLLKALGTRVGLVFKDSALPLLYAESGGHPGFTRDLGSLLLKEGKQTVTKERVKKAVTQFVANRDKNAILRTIYHDRLDEDEQALVLQLAQNGALSLKALLPKEANMQERRRLRDVLDNLVDTFVLQKLEDGRFEHRYGLLRRVIQQEAEELGL